jgi:hypothetical protein
VLGSLEALCNCTFYLVDVDRALMAGLHEVLARGDVQWVHRTLGHSVFVVIAVSLLQRLACRVLDWEVLLSSVSGTLAMFLNGVGFIRIRRSAAC